MTHSMKTTFKFKNIAQQILDWREEYVKEYGSIPSVITMSSETRIELEAFICKRSMTYRPSKPDVSGNEYIMGMLIEISDD